jgi:hypothetical protein
MHVCYLTCRLAPSTSRSAVKVAAATAGRLGGLTMGWRGWGGAIICHLDVLYYVSTSARREVCQWWFCDRRSLQGDVGNGEWTSWMVLERLASDRWWYSNGDLCRGW